MDNNKTKINADSTGIQARDLNKTFVAFLCVYFCFLFVRIVNGFPQIIKHELPQIVQSERPIAFYIIYIFSALWTLYGIWAIALSLKRSRYAITCLKLCLPVHFFTFAISTLSRISSISFGGLLLPLIIILFPLVFFIYICKSKDLKEDFPPYSRGLGFPGVTGILLYVGLLLLFIQIGAASISKARNSHKIDVETIKLCNGEFTDGRIIFKPQNTWVNDSTSVLNANQDAFYFHDSEDLSRICVVGSTEEYEPSRHFYIYSIYENQPLDTKYYSEEIGHTEVNTDESIIYVDQYRYQKDSVNYYWTYAAKIGRKFSKAIRVSILEKDSIVTTIPEVVDFLDSTALDLRPRLLKED